MRTQRKILALLISIILAMSILPAAALADEETSGTCGDSLTWNFDEERGILTISGNGAMTDYSKAEDQPWHSHASSITQIVLEKLQGYITNYRTQKVKQDLEFTEKVFSEARESYYKAQRAYAAFEDANKNIISASYRTEQERLKNEMTLTFNVYNTLAQKLEQDKLRVQEQTPVYTIIQPATVPLKAASPKKPLILIGFVFLAIFGGVGYLFIKDLFKPQEETEVLDIE